MLSSNIIYTNWAEKILKLCLPVFDGIDNMFPILIKKQKIIAYGIDGMLFGQDEYYGTDADRNNEKFRKIHKIRNPLCRYGKMNEMQNIIIPVDSRPKSISIIFLIISFFILFGIFILIKINLNKNKRNIK